MSLTLTVDPCVRRPANSWRATEEGLQEQPRQEVNCSAKVPRSEQEGHQFGRVMRRRSWEDRGGRRCSNPGGSIILHQQEISGRCGQCGHGRARHRRNERPGKTMLNRGLWGDIDAVGGGFLVPGTRLGRQSEQSLKIREKVVKRGQGALGRPSDQVGGLETTKAPRRRYLVEEYRHKNTAGFAFIGLFQHPVGLDRVFRPGNDHAPGLLQRATDVAAPDWPAGYADPRTPTSPLPRALPPAERSVLRPLGRS